MAQLLRQYLAHPLTKGLDIDMPQTTELRRRIIKEKPFLRALYKEWYQRIIEYLPNATKVPGAVLELGAGGGFLKDVLPDVISSEIFSLSGIDIVLDGRTLPFKSNSLRGIVLIDVFHHIPDVVAFLRETQRCLVHNGVVVMLEPWNTWWARFVYQSLHSEPFNMDVPPVEGWKLPDAGPLSGANGALPWIVFERDKDYLAQICTELVIDTIELDYPFSYLASGGVSMRALSPGWSYSLWRKFENAVQCLRNVLAMFAVIVIRKS